MARYEKPDDEAGKYWEITLKGLVVSTKIGKIGLGPASEWQGRMHFSERRGRTTNREHPDLATAQREHDKLVAGKLKEGFKRVDGVDPAAPPPLVVEVRSNADLEAAIMATPNDVEPYSIYADWLQSKGDPRGELIAMQIGMKNHTDAAKFMTFKKQDEYLRKTYGHMWLGAVAESESSSRGRTGSSRAHGSSSRRTPARRRSARSSRRSPNPCAVGSSAIFRCAESLRACWCASCPRSHPRSSAWCSRSRIRSPPR
jgi:uncharacterized protein (TIGR02996 family)